MVLWVKKSIFSISRALYYIFIHSSYNCLVVKPLSKQFWIQAFTMEKCSLKIEIYVIESHNRVFHGPKYHPHKFVLENKFCNIWILVQVFHETCLGSPQQSFDLKSQWYLHAHTRQWYWDDNVVSTYIHTSSSFMNMHYLPMMTKVTTNGWPFQGSTSNSSYHHHMNWQGTTLLFFILSMYSPTFTHGM